MTAFRHKEQVDMMRVYESCYGGGAHPDLYGSGPNCDLCHLYIPKEWQAICAPEENRILEEETELLDLNNWMNANSRLSCQITVTKEMEGMTVAVPDYSPVFHAELQLPGLR